MMAFLKRLIDTRVDPVTINDVESAEPNYDKEIEIRLAVLDLVSAQRDIERTSWAIRQELAGNVLSIISGEKK